MKIYEVIIIDIWNNQYHLGFFKSLEDPTLIQNINAYITNPRYHLEAGDIREYAGTFGPVFDSNLFAVLESKGVDIDECDDCDLDIQIRGFVWDRDELLNILQEV